MDKSKTLLYAKVPAAVILVASAAAHIFLDDTLSGRIDSTVLYLITTAFLIFVIPWERLKSFKAAGIEVSLEEPSIKAAIDGMRWKIGKKLEDVENEELRAELKPMGRELSAIHRARILWIDNKPNISTPVRRFLRNFGVDITSAMSSKTAEGILETDNDFDLIITDIGRTGDSAESLKNKDGLKQNRDGVSFMIKLSCGDDEFTKSIPVIFYTSYSPASAVEFTQPLRKLRHDFDICNNPQYLIPKVVRILAKPRSKPIPHSDAKEATGSS